MKNSAFFVLLNGMLIVAGYTNSAWAYLDPGTGSMVLQLLLGGVAGAVVILKLYWRRFVRLFRGNIREEAGSSSSEDQK
jgi:uncharacterized membrane protein YfcA